ERMRWVVQDLHDAPIQRHTTKEQPGLFDHGLIGVIELIAMPEALAYYIVAIEALYPRARYEQDIVASQALGATQVADLFLLRQQGDEGFRRMGLKLGAGGLFQTADMAGKLNRRHLKAKAQPQVWHLPLACILNTADHAFCTTQPVAPGDNNAVHLVEALVYRVRGVVELRGVDELQVNPDVLAGFGVHQRIGNADVRVPHGGIFSSHRNGEGWTVPFGMAHERRKGHLMRAILGWVRHIQAQPTGANLGQTLLLEQGR